jgi:ribosomal protein S12 methylthiotransferase
MPLKSLTIPRLSEKTSALVAKDNTQAAHTQKVAFVSLGCPKNLVDSEVMMGLLARAGAELSPRTEDADVIVVNTCSFIESAQEELRFWRWPGTRPPAGQKN